MRQRVLITIGVLGLGLWYLWAGRLASLPDGRGGPTILFSMHPATAAVLLGAVVLVSVVVAVVVSATGNRLAGFFVFGASLSFAALAGGRIDGWLDLADLPGDYGWLALETMLWAAALGAVALGVGLVRDRLRHRLPGWLRCRTFEEVQTVPVATEQVLYQGAALIAVVSVAVVWSLMPGIWLDFAIVVVVALACQAVCWALTIGYETLRNGRGRIEPPEAPGLLGGAVAVMIGAALTLLLARTTETQQIFAAILIGFTVAGLVAHQMFPSTRVLAIVFSPLAVALGAYVCAWQYSFHDSSSLLSTFYQSRGLYESYHFLSLVLAMPAAYAGYGVAGAALGVGWSQALFAKRHHLVTVTQ